MSSKHPDCTQCQEWELCPFHPAEPAPRAATAPTQLPEAWQKALDERRANAAILGPEPAPAASVVVPADWRLLGLDDPEVSTDLIYATPGGGVMGVPQALSATASAPPTPAPRKKAIAIGGVPFAREDFASASVLYKDYGGEFCIEVEPHSDREILLRAMYNADKLAFSTAFVAIDAWPQFDFATERAMFLARRVHPCNPTIEYVLRFFSEVPA
jgi:hypothetical protein